MATRTWTVSGPRAERRGYWQAQIDAHRRSRQSQAAFCAARGLRTGTFSFWKWKLVAPRPHQVAPLSMDTGPRYGGAILPHPRRAWRA